MRKNFDRYYGVSEQELYQRSLDDLVDYNLDIIFVNISPGLYSVFKGNHYSGPGNHFWRCVYESGLTSRLLKSSEDRKLLDSRVGLVNMFEKPSLKTVQDLSSEEIRQAQLNLTRKIRTYKPRVVAFNGKSIYETYMGSHVKSDFNFGKQGVYFDNNATNIIMFVLPSSSARCSQLPKVGDKVPFYAALKKLQEHLNGRLSGLSDADIMFPDFKVALNTGQVSGMSASGEYGGGDSANEDLDEDVDEDEDGDENDDDDTVDSGGGGKRGNRSTGGGGGAKKRRTKIKFVRLNNLPFSQLPKTIVQSLHEQRKSKRGITITTSQNYFNRSNKQQQQLNQQKTTTNINNNGSTGGASSQSSDMDTASNMTNDDSLSVDFNNKTNNNNNNGDVDKSSISSIVLNMVSSGGGGGTNNKSHHNGQVNGLAVVRQQRSPSTKLGDSRKHLKQHNNSLSEQQQQQQQQPLVITQMNLGGTGFQSGGFMTTSSLGQNIVLLNPNDPSLSGFIQQQQQQQQQHSSIVNPSGQFFFQTNAGTISQYDHQVSSQMNEFIPLNSLVSSSSSSSSSSSNQQQQQTTSNGGTFILDSSMFAQPLIPFMTDLNGQSSSSSSSFSAQPTTTTSDGSGGFITVINCNPNGSTNANLTNAILAGGDQKLMYLTTPSNGNGSNGNGMTTTNGNNIQKLIPINSEIKSHENNSADLPPVYLELVIKPDGTTTTTSTASTINNNKLSEYYTFESLLNDQNNGNAYTSAGYDQVALTTLPSSNAGGGSGGGANRKIELFYVKN